MKGLPLSDFEQNPKEHFGRVREGKFPLVLTDNGKADLVVQDAAGYQQLMERLDRAETMEALRAGLKDITEGRTIPAEDVFNELRAKYDL